MSELCEACGQPLPKDGGRLGNLIRAQRQRLQFSLRDVERLSGGLVSNPQLSQIETGATKNPTVVTLLNIAAVLGMNIADLVNAVEVPFSFAKDTNHHG